MHEKMNPETHPNGITQVAEHLFLIAYRVQFHGAYYFVITLMDTGGKTLQSFVRCRNEKGWGEWETAERAETSFQQQFQKCLVKEMNNIVDNA